MCVWLHIYTVTHIITKSIQNADSTSNLKKHQTSAASNFNFHFLTIFSKSKVSINTHNNEENRYWQVENWIEQYNKITVWVGALELSVTNTIENVYGWREEKKPYIWNITAHWWAVTKCWVFSETEMYVSERNEKKKINNEIAVEKKCISAFFSCLYSHNNSIFNVGCISQYLHHF